MFYSVDSGDLVENEKILIEHYRNSLVFRIVLNKDHIFLILFL